jgi:MYXO-CTERM domain-containing protein
MKRLILSTALLLLFVGAASANQFGASTSGTIGAYATSGDSYPFVPGGIALGGEVTGPGYTLGFDGAIFCPGGGGWYWCSGGYGTATLDIGGVPQISYYSYPAGSTLSDNPIVVVVDADGTFYTFDLQDDPVSLSSLVPAGSGNGVEGVNYVDLTVTGGCTGTSCGASTSPTPEPSGFVLLGSGLAGLGFIRRRFSRV